MSGMLHLIYHPSSNQLTLPVDIKAQLAELAARQSGGKTTDPAAVQGVSAINAKIPAVHGQDEKKPGEGKGKNKGKMSSRQKQRADKMKERAVDLGGKLEKKVAAKEGRKVSFLVLRGVFGTLAGQLREEVF